MTVASIRGTIAALIVMIGTAPATAQLPPLSAQASRACDALTAKVVEATGARFERRWQRGGHIVVLKHPLANEMSLGCPRPQITGWGADVFVSFDGAFPPAGFFDLIATAAHAALDLPRDAVRAAAVECHRAALRAASETAEVNRGRAHLECQSFSRDGGGTAISVFRRHD